MTKYKETTKEVILESTMLTDEKKLKSEFFEDKVRSILGSIAFTVQVRLFHTQNLVCIIYQSYYKS